MGVNQKLIRAELYKLLIYDPGAFFLPHRDTLKAPGMFGTLVIVLPSDHTGGELVVTHGNRKVTLSLANNEVSAIHYAAFYADCEHEVKPILSGTRIALVYNLTRLVQFARLEGGYYTDEDREREDLKDQEMEELQKNRAAAAVVAGKTGVLPLIEKLAEKLTRTFDLPPAPAKLVYLLSHYYTPNDLSPGTLKSEDLAVASSLVRAAELSDCDVHLGIVHITAYHNGSNVSRQKMMVDGIMAMDGRRWNLGSLVVAENELFPSGYLDNVRPDEDLQKAFVGNDAGEPEAQYHYAGLLIWKKEALGVAMMQNGAPRAGLYLERLIADNALDSDAIFDLVDEIPLSFDTKARQTRHVIGALMAAPNPDPLHSFVGRWVDVTSELCVQPIIWALPCLDTDTLVDLLGRFVLRLKRDDRFDDCDFMRLVNGVADALEAAERHEVFQAAGSYLCDVAISHAKPPPWEV